MPVRTTTTEEPLLHVKVEGTSYRLFKSRMTAVDIGDLRRSTGLTLASLLLALSEEFDIDVIAAVMWLSRRQNGEPKLTYESVAAALGYDVTIENGALPAAEEPAEDDSPEA